MANINVYKSRANYFWVSCRLFRDITVSSLDLQKVGPGTGLQFSQCCSSMTNKEFHKSRQMHFCANFIISQMLMFQNVHLQKVGQRNGVQFLQWRSRMSNIKIYKSPSSRRFRDVNGSYFYLQKAGHFHANICNYHFLHFFCFRPATISADENNRHTH